MVSTAFGTTPAPGPVLAVAHRGASDLAPENTLSAIRRAVGLGADLVEVDLRRTKDGALVLLHDRTLARTTDAVTRLPDLGPWRVEDLTLDEVRRLDAGSWKSPGYAGEQVPTLGDALALLARSSVPLLLEVKSPGAAPGIVEEVAAALTTSGAAGRVIVQSFDHAAMRRLRSFEPRLRVGVLGTPACDELRWYAEWADLVNPCHRCLDKAYVDEVHRWGMASLVWTVDRPSVMRRALRDGVDGVITNRLTQLEAVLGQPAAGIVRPRRRATTAVP